MNLYFRKKATVYLTSLLKLSIDFFLILSFYHFIYLPFNLSERLPISLEFVLITIYFILISLGIWKLLENYWNIRKNFNRILENEFNLGFKWYNIIYKLKAKQIDKNDLEVKEILSSIKPFQHFLLQEKHRLISFIITFVMLVSIHSISFIHLSFFNNVTSILKLPIYHYQLDYAKDINIGENLVVKYQGNFADVTLIKEKEKIKISQEKPLVLSNISQSISLPIIMSSKRIQKKRYNKYKS